MVRAGVFFAPLPGPNFRDILGMLARWFIMKAFPGHHFQIALQREMESLPRYRRDGIFAGGSAFSEG